MTDNFNEPHLIASFMKTADIRSVPFMANLLSVSRQTIYNYLSKDESFITVGMILEMINYLNTQNIPYELEFNNQTLTFKNGETPYGHNRPPIRNTTPIVEGM